MSEYKHILTSSVAWGWGKNDPPAEVTVDTKAKTIRIKGYGSQSSGLLPNGQRALYRPKFDRTFKVGDVVEYGSYNLRYTGPIVSIGPKVVKVSCAGTGERCRNMTHREFISRNWDLDLEEVAKHNSTEMLYI